jgi:hypothetical protein
MQINSCSDLANSTTGDLIVQCEINHSHDNFIIKALRCHGKNRAKQAEVLVISGATNTRNSNIIENQKTIIKGNYF